MWLEPFPDTAAATGLEPGPSARYEQRESLELAFVAALQYLPASQRAALILRDVLGFSAADAAEALETTITSINSALQHARKNIAARVPDGSQQDTLRSMGDDQLRQLVDRYMRAFEEADLEAMVSLLAEDATWSMPPLSESYQGHRAISEFLQSRPFTIDWRHLPTRANGQPAVACYAWDEATGSFRGTVLDVLTLDRDFRLSAVTAFIDHTLFERFGLPAELPV
jgi:RNA polymerase sigma-70 factor (ECF subfamily)